MHPDLDVNPLDIAQAVDKTVEVLRRLIGDVPVSTSVDVAYSSFSVQAHSVELDTTISVTWRRAWRSYVAYLFTVVRGENVIAGNFPERLVVRASLHTD